MENELNLIPTDILLKELDKRFNHWVFSGLKEISINPDRIFTMRKWGGNSATCCGLASMLQVAIFDEHFKNDELGTGEYKGEL